VASDEALRASLGRNARHRVRDLFTWDERGRELSRLYEHASKVTRQAGDGDPCVY
jgi:glycosyltransferase involved in cell wall biosynthesis